jgi:PBS lyase HEAT-like repeat-containing protein
MQVFQGKLFLSVTLVVVFSLSGLALQRILRQQHPTQNEVVEQNNIEATLTKLQSGDQSDLLEAKAELLAMGTIAIEPLISLLKELTNNTDQKGALTSEQALEHRKISLDAHANSVAKNAIYDVLGHLRAAEAVPLLVIIMEEEEIDNMIQGMSPVMRSLAEIGPAAVPSLIESINKATDSLLILIGPNEAARQNDLVGGKGRIELGRIQLRATLVLRAIGDQRAIPALQRLHDTSKNPFIVREAREAIESIHNRTNR